MKQNNRGVAILMVMTTLAILTIVMAEFLYETKLNKIKIYNAQYRTQARLNAEAGLKFAIAKLRLYQETRNMIEKNENLKKMVDPGMLQGFITMPFIYPIPNAAATSVALKSTITDFTKNNLIVGEFAVEMSVISGFLNPNNLRIPSKKITPSEEIEIDGSTKDEFNLSNYIEKEMVNTLTNLINDKKEDDEEFNTKFGSIDPSLLIKELKYFVNDEGKVPDDETSDITPLYDKANIKPKFGAMSSLSEMYAMAGWDDEIIELMKPQLTVHQIRSVPINNMNERDVRMIFPEMTKEQIKQFFKYRNGGDEEEPHPFKNVEDLKNVITTIIGVMDAEAFDKRTADLKKAGINFGLSGQLFKILSVGRYESATYTLAAYVDLPSKAPPEKKAAGAPGSKGELDDEEEIPPKTQPGTQPKEGADENKAEPPLELLEPRIVEISLGEI